MTPAPTALHRPGLRRAAAVQNGHLVNAPPPASIDINSPRFQSATEALWTL
jgi:hypothetical protein